MAAQIFTNIAAKADRAKVQRNSEKSKLWFMRHVANIRNIQRKSLLGDDTLIQKNKPLIGRMFMFFYDPKTKLTLPYYDEFPLIIMVGPAPQGFYGLNLHYLPPRMRAVFFDNLMEHLNNDKLDETTKFKLNYNMLSSAAKLKAFEPCFKRYLFEHVKSKTVEVPPSQWETAMFLPTDSFAGSTRNKIWNISKKYRS